MTLLYEWESIQLYLAENRLSNPHTNRCRQELRNKNKKQYVRGGKQFLLLKMSDLSVFPPQQSLMFIYMQRYMIASVVVALKMVIF